MFKRAGLLLFLLMPLRFCISTGANSFQSSRCRRCRRRRRRRRRQRLQQRRRRRRRRRLNGKTG